MPTVINPYTFIPFGSEPTRSNIAETYADPSGLLTGWIDAQLRNTTGLIIPGKIEGKDEEHKKLYFFKTPDGKIAIPGSELRGMLRSEYEAVTNSCLPFLKDDKRVSMRVPPLASLKDRGLLVCEDGKWSLWATAAWYQKAENLGEDTGWCGHFPGETVKFRPTGTISEGRQMAELDPNGPKEGILQFMKPISMRDYHVAFLQKCGSDPLFTYADDSICDVLIEELDSHATANSNPNPFRVPLQNLIRRVRNEKNGMIPVWYTAVKSPVENKVVSYSISPSSIGRVNQEKKWRDIMGEYVPCTDPACSCPACQLFGMVQGDTQIHGRLRFGDATLEDGVTPQLNLVTLPILGEPKPTAFSFYINKPNDPQAAFWNYDIYTHRAQQKQKVPYYVRYDATPRGRKFYLHGMEQVCKERSKFNATAEVLKKKENGKNVPYTFNFRVYFDGITEAQLKQLEWLLTLGENTAESLYQHKLGHGRPVGYGSVKITIQRVMQRILTAADGQLSYTMADIPIENERIRGDAARRLRLISSWGTVSGEYVQYPNANDGEKGPQVYKWFANNLRQDDEETLPLVGDNGSLLMTTDAILYGQQKAPTVEEQAPGTQTAPRTQTAPAVIREGDTVSGKVKWTSPKRCGVMVNNREYTVEVIKTTAPKMKATIQFVITDFTHAKGEYRG